MPEKSKAFGIGFNVPFVEAIEAALNRGTVLPDVYYNEMAGIAHQLAFSIAGIASYDQIDAVNQALKKFMAEGGTFNEWKRQAAVMNLGLPEHRLDNIWRTNLQGNYMRGQWQQFVENADTRPYLMYDAINDERVRPTHLAHDGTIRPYNDTFWKTHSPPLGYRCRCSLISLTEEQAQARSGFDDTGNGKGLQKVPKIDGMEAQPDIGWDYNPYEDRMKFVDQMLEDRGITMEDVIKPWAERVAPWQDKAIAYHAKIQGRSQEEVIKAIDQGLKDGVQKQEVWLVADNSMLKASVEKGRIVRGTESVATTMVNYAVNLRGRFNAQVLELERGEDATHGFLSALPYGRAKMNSLFGNVHIKLKPHVKHRTTFANAEAVFNTIPQRGVIVSPITNPSWRSVRIRSAPNGIPDLSNMDNLVDTWATFTKGDVTLEDIERVYFEEQPSQRMIDRLRRAGVDWAMVPADYEAIPLDDRITFDGHYRTV